MVLDLPLPSSCPAVTNTTDTGSSKTLLIQNLKSLTAIIHVSLEVFNHNRLQPPSHAEQQYTLIILMLIQPLSVHHARKSRYSTHYGWLVVLVTIERKDMESHTHPV